MMMMRRAGQQSAATVPDDHQQHKQQQQPGGRVSHDECTERLLFSIVLDDEPFTRSCFGRLPGWRDIGHSSSREHYGHGEYIDGWNRICIWPGQQHQ